MKVLEENKKEKLRKKMSNSTKWMIFVTAFLIVLVITTVINLSFRKKVVEVSGKDEIEEKLEENIKEEVKLSELTQTENKTEEELKKLNEKELEENQKKTNNITRRQNKYYLKVNYGAQVVNVYTYDKDGKYTVPVKAFVCSTGTATPKSGVYKIPAKITWCYLFGDVWGHYSTQIVGDILFHTVPYAEKRNDSLEWWLYDRLGTKDSMGCVRLTARDAKWIYDNVTVGSSVEFYSSSNPGPLGKPSAQKISNAPKKLRVWDPTDPDYKNPWRTYQPSNNNTNNIVQNTTNNTITNSTNSNNEQTNQETNEQQTNNIQTNETIENEEQPENNETPKNENTNLEDGKQEENEEQQNGEISNTPENEMVNEENK